MKLLFLVLLVFLFNTALCQYGNFQLFIAGADSNIMKDPVFIELTLDTQKISSGYIPFNRLFDIERLVPGMYKLAIHQIGRRPDYYDSLIILDGQTKKLTATYPGPCQFIYSKGYKPKCPFGHSDNIIPIVYGMPGKKLMEKSQHGKIYLGGCLISDCDPRYYCRLHKIEI
jgi:hypothetical protein